MLDKLGWCARNPPALLGSSMASSSWRRPSLGPCSRGVPFRSRETVFATPAELPAKPYLTFASAWPGRGSGRRPILCGGSPRWRRASFLPGVRQERCCALFRRRRSSSVESDRAREWDPVTVKAADGTCHVRRWIRDRDRSKALVRRHWRSGSLISRCSRELEAMVA